MCLFLLSAIGLRLVQTCASPVHAARSQVCLCASPTGPSRPWFCSVIHPVWLLSSFCPLVCRGPGVPRKNLFWSSVFQALTLCVTSGRDITYGSLYLFPSAEEEAPLMMTEQSTSLESKLLLHSLSRTVIFGFPLGPWPI